MHNYDGIIFDVDGTLTSTNDLIFESFRFIANKYLNKYFSNEDIMKLFGPPEDVILKEWTGDNYDSARKDYYDYYTKNHNMAHLFPGIKEVLSFIKSKKVLLAIFTGKGREAATITLKKLEIYDYFDMVITGDDVINHKPSSEGINNFINEYKLDKNRALMIGDAPGDFIAARSAGVKIASVLWDPYVKEEVKNLSSDFLFYTVDEFKEFIFQNI
ncbi:MAG: HAD family hydrolase [Ignavibacteriaceae bacterium]|nr:HAD family hydrolase [Ignavibacteriaceae bacterium]